MKTAYFVKGNRSLSKLTEPGFQKVFQSIFHNYTVVFDTSNNKSAFLTQFFQSDFAYLNVHNSPGTMNLTIANGDRVSLEEIKGACQKIPVFQRPKLVIVVGCQTVNNPAGNLASAIGIEATTSKRAFIGFSWNVFGAAADAYFRMFLAHWMKPRPYGRQRTLTEARYDTEAFMNRQMKTQEEIKALKPNINIFDVPEVAEPGLLLEVNSYDFLPQVALWGSNLSPKRITRSIEAIFNAPMTPSDASIGDQFTIIGDLALRASDL